MGDATDQSFASTASTASSGFKESTYGSQMAVTEEKAEEDSYPDEVVPIICCIICVLFIIMIILLLLISNLYVTEYEDEEVTIKVKYRNVTRRPRTTTQPPDGDNRSGYTHSSWSSSPMTTDSGRQSTSHRGGQSRATARFNGSTTPPTGRNQSVGPTHPGSKQTTDPNFQTNYTKGQGRTTTPGRGPSTSRRPVPSRPSTQRPAHRPTARPIPTPRPTARPLGPTPRPTATRKPLTGPASGPTTTRKPTTRPLGPTPRPTATRKPLTRPTSGPTPRPTATRKQTARPIPGTTTRPTTPRQPTTRTTPRPTAPRKPTTRSVPGATTRPTAPRQPTTRTPRPTAPRKPTTRSVPGATTRPTAPRQPTTRTTPRPTAPRKPTTRSVSGPTPRPTAPQKETTRTTPGPTPRPTAPRKPTTRSVPDPTLRPTAPPKPTTRSVSGQTPRPTAPPKPTTRFMPGPTPRPTAPPKPTTRSVPGPTPRPTAPPRPTTRSVPGPTPRPTAPRKPTAKPTPGPTPRPTATRKPTSGPIPGRTPGPTAGPTPPTAPTSKPTATRKPTGPTGGPTPGPTPGPTSPPAPTTKTTATRKPTGPASGPTPRPTATRKPTGPTAGTTPGPTPGPTPPPAPTTKTTATRKPTGPASGPTPRPTATQKSTPGLTPAPTPRPTPPSTPTTKSTVTQKPTQKPTATRRQTTSPTTRKPTTTPTTRKATAAPTTATNQTRRPTSTTSRMNTTSNGTFTLICVFEYLSRILPRSTPQCTDYVYIRFFVYSHRANSDPLVFEPKKFNESTVKLYYDETQAVWRKYRSYRSLDASVKSSKRNFPNSRWFLGMWGSAYIRLMAGLWDAKIFREALHGTLRSNFSDRLAMSDIDGFAIINSVVRDTRPRGRAQSYSHIFRGTTYGAPILEPKWVFIHTAAIWPGGNGVIPEDMVVDILREADVVGLSTSNSTDEPNIILQRASSNPSPYLAASPPNPIMPAGRGTRGMLDILTGFPHWKQVLGRNKLCFSVTSSINYAYSSVDKIDFISPMRSAEHVQRYSRLRFTTMEGNQYPVVQRNTSYYFDNSTRTHYWRYVSRSNELLRFFAYDTGDTLQYKVTEMLNAYGDDKCVVFDDLGEDSEAVNVTVAGRSLSFAQFELLRGVHTALQNKYGAPFAG